MYNIFQSSRSSAGRHTFNVINQYWPAPVLRSAGRTAFLIELRLSTGWSPGGERQPPMVGRPRSGRRWRHRRQAAMVGVADGPVTYVEMFGRVQPVKRSGYHPKGEVNGMPAFAAAEAAQSPISLAISSDTSSIHIPGASGL
jgi:hypothetical protein